MARDASTPSINVDELFEYCERIRLPVCRKCRHCVWTEQIVRHLRGREHGLSAQDAHYIQSVVQQWPDTLRVGDPLPVIHAVIPYIPELEVYRDGWLCIAKPNQCRYISRTEKTMTTHFSTTHPGFRGVRGVKCRATREQAKDQPWRSVNCQRLFPRRHGSQFFEVHVPTVVEETTPTAPPPPPPTKIERAREMLQQRMEKIQDRERRIIDEGGHNEPSPWLERTGWAQHLRKLDRDELLQSIATPEVDEEPIGRVIWEAMDQMMRQCQATIREHAGVFVRKEVMRTEEDQSRFVPLKGYQNPEEIQDKGRHWQQIVMFFVRTQQPHLWKSPPYTLKRHQQQAFQQLMREASQDVEQKKLPHEEGEHSTAVAREQINDTDVESPDETSGDGDDDEKLWYSPAFVPLEGTRRACLAFCISLLCQKAQKHEYEHALVCALAVLGVDPHGWKGYDTYPPILSSVIKIGRMMTIQHAFQATTPDPDTTDRDHFHGPVDGGADDIHHYGEHDDPLGPESKQVGCIDMIQHMVDQFMLRTSHGPMEWMLDLRTYGMKIQFSGTAPGYIDWHGDQIMYKDIQFTMSQFRGMVHQIVHDTRERLLRRVLDIGPQQEPELPVIPWDELRDDPANAQPGWNFVQDRRNPWPVDGQWWLFHRLMKSGQYQLLHDGDDVRWNVEEAQRWLAEDDAVREGLLLLKQFTGGGPRRAPELLSIRHSNTSHGGYRNVGIEGGLVFTATRYHKGYSMSGDVKIIHQYYPREVSELDVWWMWLVLPLRQRIEAEIYHRESRTSFIWPRQSPSGHTFTPERLREGLKRVGMVHMGQPLNIQIYRHLGIGMGRRYLQTKSGFEYDPEDEEGEINEDEDDIIDQSAGHISHIAWSIYARGIGERDGEVANKREKFRRVSVAWHRFLGFESSWEDGRQRRRGGRDPFEKEAEAGRFRRWQHLRQVNIQMALEKMMGRGHRFRGVQRDAIQAVMRGDPRVMVFMGTGGGKSLIFMLPAWCGMGRGGMTVVVVPLIALRRDMKRRCQELGLECVEWSSSRIADSADIVLVTPESVFSAAFQKFMQRMKSGKRLDRIVVDECHVVLNKQKHFRRRLQQLGELNQWDVQTLMLTATMPVHMEDEFRRRMGIVDVAVSTFRDRTTRKNIAYRIHRLRSTKKGGSKPKRSQRSPPDSEEVSASAQMETVADFVRQQGRRYPDGKVVVYCQTVPQTKALAALLECDAYHHHAGDKDIKMRAFQSGEKSLMVSTSAFGMGVDISDIRVIIHVDEPRSLLDYGQESGRAGREGQKSEAIIILPAGANRNCPPSWHPQGKKMDEAARRRVWDFIEAGCQREVMDQFMDGNVHREGCGSEEEACQGCCQAAAWEEGEEAREGGVAEEEEVIRGELERGSDESLDDSASSDHSESESESDHDGYGGSKSQKRGFDAAWFDAAWDEGHEFQQQQVRQQRIGQGWQKQKQENRRIMEDTREYLELVRGKCIYCYWQGSTARVHSSIYHCPQPSAQEARGWYKSIKGQIRGQKVMEQFVGCAFCFVPQAWCRGWRHKVKGVGDEGFERVVDRNGRPIQCQYEDVVLSIVVMAIVFEGDGREKYVDGLDRRIQQNGGEGVEEPGDLVRYFSQAADGGGLETSRLLQECWHAWQHLQQFTDGLESVRQIDESRLQYMFI
jgi:superfamily II DNA helicase RecQ